MSHGSPSIRFKYALLITTPQASRSTFATSGMYQTTLGNFGQRVLFREKPLTNGKIPRNLVLVAPFQVN